MRVAINNFFVLSSFTVLMFITACNKKENLSADEYLEFVQNDKNGLTADKLVDDFEFSVLYKPVEYVVALECRNKNISVDSIQNRIKKLKGHQYYTLRIRSLKDDEFIKTGLSSENEYYSRLEYMVSFAQMDMKLVEGKDTLPCVSYHFERNYGVSPVTNIVMAFEEIDTTFKNDKIFIYDDKILGVGKVALKFEAKDLKNIPTLNL